MTGGGSGRLVRALATACAVGCLALTGCGGGDDEGSSTAADAPPPATTAVDPKETYAAEVRRVIGETTEGAAQAGARVDEAQSPDELASAVGEVEAVMAVAVDRYRALKPPAELRDLNDRFVMLHESYTEQTAATRSAIEQGDVDVSGFREATTTYGSELGLLAQELDAAAGQP